MKNRESIEQANLKIILGWTLAMGLAISPAFAANNAQNVQVQPIKNDKKQVSMVVTEVGRSNPFEPVFGGYDEDTDYYLAAPPEVPGLDNDALDVIKARVAGIIYDKNNVNSSAIVNIGGSDYLTRIGDKINGYVVTAIDRNDITVQLGANTFKAGVGDIISTEDLYDVNKTRTPALETKFAGRKKVN